MIEMSPERFEELALQEDGCCVSAHRPVSSLESTDLLLPTRVISDDSWLLMQAALEEDGCCVSARRPASRRGQDSPMSGKPLVRVSPLPVTQISENVDDVDSELVDLVLPIPAVSAESLLKAG